MKDGFSSPLPVPENDQSMDRSGLLLQAINEVREGRGEPALTTLDPTLRFREDGGFDSFDLAELTVRVEEKTGVDLFGKGVVLTLGEALERLTEGAPNE